VSRNWFARKFGSPRWRFGLTLLCLLVFTAQSTVAQAHVHSATRSEAGTSFTRVVSASLATDVAKASASDLSPDLSKGTPARRAHDTDSGFCPLCQFLLLSGAALLPTFSTPLPSAAAVSFVSVDQASPHSIAAVSYSWQGRGPPRA
jgi:hypothetical protein